MEMTSDNLHHLFLDCAYESLGMYPAARIENGIETKRTEWQDGWNAAIMKVSSRTSILVNWYESLSKDNQDIVKFLIDRDVLNFHVEQELVTMWVLTNDFFYPAADGEDVKEAELYDLKRLVDIYGVWGDLIFASRKRGNAMPWKGEQPEYKPFYEAMKIESV